MMDKINPTVDRVLVRPIKETENLPAGLVAPESYADHRGRGVVEGVGPGRVTPRGVRVEMTVAEGDVVIYPKAAGVQIPGDERLLLYEGEILAVLG